MKQNNQLQLNLELILVNSSLNITWHIDPVNRHFHKTSLLKKDMPYGVYVQNERLEASLKFFMHELLSLLLPLPDLLIPPNPFG